MAYRKTLEFKQITKQHLTSKQQQVLQAMYDDYQDRPIDLTQFELAVRYKCSAEVVRSIVGFLKRHEMIEQFRIGYRYLSKFKPTVLEYIVNPLEWTVNQCKEITYSEKVG